MQIDQGYQKTIVPENPPQVTKPLSPVSSTEILRADDRTRHHKKIMMIAAIGIITVLIALAVVVWFQYQATIKTQSLQNEYQIQSFQNSVQEAKAFFAEYPTSNDPKVIAANQAASQKTAATFFKNNPPVVATSAQLAAQAAQLQAMYQQGFTDWKTAQGK